MTTPLYFDSPLTLNFTARVTESRPLGEGRFGIVMPETFFYPTSGGQEHDTGFIGEARVLDVTKDGDDILHVTDKPLAPGGHPARIDRQRRLRAMQHHTAQHILSASFLKVADIPSLSANINGDNPSTIDLDAGDVPADLLRRAEDLANQTFLDNRAIKTYNVTQDEAARLPLRKTPKVSGLIRIVEVDGFDFTPCGGTHCPTTGMVGLLKIIKTERVNQKFRIYFVAGLQALDTFRAYHSTLQQVANLLETNWDSTLDILRRRLDQLRAATSDLDSLRADLLAVEAFRLADAARAVGSLRLVTATFRARPVAELRTLASKLLDVPHLVSLLASYDNGKLTLVSSCAADTGQSARDLLQKHLAPLHLRGGGDSSLAQGGGATDESSLSTLFAHTESLLQ
jgi:alanyl-tRNA synthetase